VLPFVEQGIFIVGDLFGRLLVLFAKRLPTAGFAVGTRGLLRYFMGAAHGIGKWPFECQGLQYLRWVLLANGWLA